MEPKEFLEIDSTMMEAIKGSAAARLAFDEWVASVNQRLSELESKVAAAQASADSAQVAAMSLTEGAAVEQ